MRRNEFESRYNNWEGRQLVAVIIPKTSGNTALQVQWAGLEEIREAATVESSWASKPEDDQFFGATVTDAEVAKAFDETVETPSNETDASSSFDKVEDFVEAVVSRLNKGDTICFGFPNGSLAVAATNTATVDEYSLIARTTKAINEAWSSLADMEGWEKPSIYVDYSGKP